MLLYAKQLKYFANAAFSSKYLDGAIPSLQSYVWKLRLLTGLAFFSSLHCSFMKAITIIQSCIFLNTQTYEGCSRSKNDAESTFLSSSSKALIQHQAPTSESTESACVVTHWLLWCEQALIKQKRTLQSRNNMLNFSWCWCLVDLLLV